MKGRLEFELDQEAKEELMDAVAGRLNEPFIEKIIEVLQVEWRLRVCTSCSEVVSTANGSHEGVLLQAENRLVGTYCPKCCREFLKGAAKDNDPRYSVFLDIVARQAAYVEHGISDLPDALRERYAFQIQPWDFWDVPGFSEKFDHWCEKVQES